MSHTVAANTHAVAGKHEYALKFDITKFTDNNTTIRSLYSIMNETGDITWKKPSGAFSNLLQLDPSWIDELGTYELHSDCWANIKSLEFNDKIYLGQSYDSIIINFNSWDFRYLSGLETLIVRSSSSFGDASLMNIDKCSNLKYLIMNSVPITGDFSELNLETLSLLERLQLEFKMSWETYAMTSSLSSIDLSIWPNLAYFHLSNTNISGDLSELTIGNCPNLKDLTISNGTVTGNISDLDLTGAPLLESLNIGGQNLTSISGLDLSANTNLTYFYAANNPSMTGDVTQFVLPPSILNFYVGASQCTGNIANIDFSKTPNIVRYYVDKTQVSGNIHEVSFLNAPNLQYFAIGDNVTGNFNQIDYTGASSLRQIYFSHTAVGGTIAGADLSPLVSLYDIQMDSSTISGNIEDFDFSSNLSLDTLILRDMPNLTGNINNLNAMNLRVIYLDRSPVGGDLTLWDLSKHSSLEYLSADNTDIGGDITNMIMPTSIKSLGLKGTQVSGNVGNLDLSSYTSLLGLGIEQCNNLTGSLATIVFPPQVISFSVGSNNASYVGDIGELPLPSRVRYFTSRQSKISYPSTGKSLSNPWVALSHVDISHSAISQTDLDNLLADCVTSGSTGKLLSIAYTSSAPSTAGQNSIATLQSRGWTIYI